MYWDLLKVDLFLCQMHSNKCLASFAAITVSLTHPWIYFALVCLVCTGPCLCITVDKMQCDVVCRECQVPWTDY